LLLKQQQQQQQQQQLTDIVQIRRNAGERLVVTFPVVQPQSIPSLAGREEEPRVEPCQLPRSLRHTIRQVNGWRKGREPLFTFCVRKMLSGHTLRCTMRACPWRNDSPSASSIKPILIWLVWDVNHHHYRRRRRRHCAPRAGRAPGFLGPRALWAGPRNP